MRKPIICTLLFLLTACSANNSYSPTKPIVDTPCNQPQSTEPIEGGLGGTGALPEENCPTNDGQI